MKKILVPTDFSVNSKSAVRFAMHWSARQKLELVFVHVLHILRPTRWSDAYFEKYARQQEFFCLQKLKKFIAGIYRTMKVIPGTHSFLILQGDSPDVSLLDYCCNHKDIDSICISTRGAGRFNKIFGSVTGNLLSRSAVPVFVIPKSYRRAGIKKVLYASDMKHCLQEIKRVSLFASGHKAAIQVLHLNDGDFPVQSKPYIEKALRKKYNYTLDLLIENYDTGSFTENLQRQVRLKKPSVVVMFTDQQRNFFMKLFRAGRSEQLSVRLKTPLLVFNKQTGEG